MNDVFQYPPELLNLLIDAVPVLCRSKRDVVTFFRGAGVTSSYTNDLVRRLNKDKDSISKYEIARTILIRLNEKGEIALPQRREVLKRVVEYEDFSTCWPNDQLKAKGLVAEIRRVVNVKDSFTRIDQERERERRERQIEHLAKQEAETRRRAKLTEIKTDLFSLFKETNAHSRGKALEGVLNRLFDSEGVLIQEAFTVKGDEGEGIIEQIDGVIEIDGNVYLVEMKWWNENLGPGEVSQHLVRVFGRGYARGIFISNSDYTSAAQDICRQALQQTVVVLCKLEEFVWLLEKEGDIKSLLKEKINAAIVHRNPLYEPLKFGVA
jgi:restriction endonuclease Mrr